MALLVGAGGLGALVFVLLLMWMVVLNDDMQNTPAPGDDQAPQEVLTDPPAAKSSEPDKPQKPEKPPPLNQ